MCLDTSESYSLPDYYKVISKLSNTSYCKELLSGIDKNISLSNKPEVLLLEKSEILRRLGLIDESIDTLKTLCSEYNFNSRARLLLNSLEPRESKSAPRKELFTPSPFVNFQQCFGENVIQELLRHIKQNAAKFQQAGIGHKREINTKKRNTLYIEDIGPFQKVIENKIRSDIPTVIQNLGIEAFRPSKIELKITNHLNMHFFNIHKDDCSPGNSTDRRIISFVYYIYTLPKRFSGGDLLLFDTNSSTSSYKNFQFTRIPCNRNTLTYFPSQYYHCVDVVKQNSNDFLDGRLAVSGHIRSEMDEDK